MTGFQLSDFTCTYSLLSHSVGSTVGHIWLLGHIGVSLKKKNAITSLKSAEKLLHCLLYLCRDCNPCDKLMEIF